jgi:hypothetical protein
MNVQMRVDVLRTFVTHLLVRMDEEKIASGEGRKWALKLAEF